MFDQNSQLFRLGVGGLGGFGPGIAGFKSWIVAFVIMLVLAWLAWWTMRPARRATRARPRDGANETELLHPTPGHAGDDSSPRQWTGNDR